NVRQSSPDAQMAVANDQLRTVQAPLLQVPEDRRPGLGRFPAATLYGNDHLAPIPQSSHDNQDGCLVLLQTGLDVDAVHPQIDDSQVAQRTLPPFLVFRLPNRLETIDGARRQRRRFSQQATQRQIEIAGREPVQIQLRQQLSDLLALPLEQRQDAALKPLAESTQPGAPHRYGAVAER